MSTVTYTVVLPDGTTSTRKSKTHAFTHGVVKFTSAETMARQIRWAIDRIKDDIAEAETHDPAEKMKHRRETYGEYIAEARIEIARLEAQTATAADYYSIVNWCESHIQAEKMLTIHARHVPRDSLRIVEVRRETV
jgi:hypothetical protein